MEIHKEDEASFGRFEQVFVSLDSSRGSASRLRFGRKTTGMSIAQPRVRMDDAPSVVRGKSR